MSGVFDRRPGVAASGDESVAAGGDIGVAVTGAGAVGTQYTQQHIAQYIDKATIAPAEGHPHASPKAESVDAPAGLTNLPERPELFVGRERELALLDAALASPGGAVVQALHGLGGIGKSTLAARWVANHPQYSPTWWITADSRAALDAGLAGLAAAVERDLTRTLQQQQLRDWAVQWLAVHENWLIVLDNVSDPADLKPLLAAAGNGRFLITSRRSSGWHGLAQPVHLDVLAHDDALDLFTRICPDAGDEVGRLCTELGCLPLAVEQAASYCAETVTTAADYLALLASYPADMYAAAAEGGDTERTVARVWHLTLDRLADDPLAVRILLTLAWYAPDDVPRSLLDTLGSPIAVRRALGRLAAHSMLTLRGDSLSLHRLVQAVARTSDPGDPHRGPAAVGRAREMAAEALVEGLPSDTGDPALWPRWRALLPHVEALAEHAPQDADSVDLARVFSIMGEFLAGYGLGERAERLLERGESGLVRHLGPEHRLSLVARNRLVHVADVAVQDAMDHVDRCERILGAEDPETITALYEVGREHATRDATEEALALYDQVIRRRTDVLGPAHRDTLAARAERAALALMDGGIAEAIEDLREVYDDTARELGETHPLTLDLRGQLAVTASGMGDLVIGAGSVMRWADASNETEMRSQLSAYVERVRGVTADQMKSWAGGMIGNLKEHLANCEAVLGPGHGDTVHARLMLVQAHMLAGDMDSALAHAGRSAADAEQTLGSGHPAATVARVMSTTLSMMQSIGPEGEASPEATAEVVAGFRELLDPEDEGRLTAFMSWMEAAREELRKGGMPTLSPFLDTGPDGKTPDA
ncbi:tetratricopeptide repeat protein [Streptomyces sp. NPDC059010]|uniref:tetratricopeptide repeat protein n=1 Tax=Streptomyces sp. NPDC059010 TaxID=3346695 RepID=UPI00368A48A6